MAVIKFSHDIDEGYILSIQELREHLQRISRGIHQWVATPLPHPVEDRYGRMRNYILVGYSNPDPPGMPNYLCYLFPLIQRLSPVASGDDALVCLHPSMVIPLTGGLYFEHDALKYDMLEDWDRFWSPLREAVSPSPPQIPRTSKPAGSFPA